MLDSTCVYSIRRMSSTLTEGETVNILVRENTFLVCIEGR